MVALVLGAKWLILRTPDIGPLLGLDHPVPISGLMELSDVGIVFTGAFFVLGLILAGTMTDFKESEKIPGEVASNLEALEDHMLLALRTHRPAEGRPVLDEQRLYQSLRGLTQVVHAWFHSPEKDSKQIFPAIKRVNEITHYIASLGGEKEAIKGLQDNLNQLRKNLTRAYTISRTNFIAPAYVLLKSIVALVVLLLLFCKFKSTTAAFAVTGVISFIFLYLLQLIQGLDNPFDSGEDCIAVDMLPLDRFKDRIEAGFHRATEPRT